MKASRRQKSNLFWLFILMLVILTTFVIFPLVFNQNVEPQTAYVRYEELNVRTSPVNGEVIAVLYQGDSVELTGERDGSFGGSHDEQWGQICWGDTTAWVSLEGLDL